MYIKEYTNGIFVRTEKTDRACSHQDGHEFTIHGAWGSTCHHCGHYIGGTRMETIGEAQWYAQSILGATGPVEVR